MLGGTSRCGDDTLYVLALDSEGNECCKSNLSTVMSPVGMEPGSEAGWSGYGGDCTDNSSKLDNEPILTSQTGYTRCEVVSAG